MRNLTRAFWRGVGIGTYTLTFEGFAGAFITITGP